MKPNRNDSTRSCTRWRAIQPYLALLDSQSIKCFANDTDDPRSVSSAKMMTVIRCTHSRINGFVWKPNLLDNDEWGYRMLLGGIGGRSTTQWLSPSATRQLTLKRLSQLAAEHVVSEAVMAGDHELF